MRDKPHDWLLPYLLLATFCVVATWRLTIDSVQRTVTQATYFAAEAREELLPIQHKYGPRRFSRNVEEWIIRDFFQDRRDGVFLDVGANHYMKESNTYYLEIQLGWSGVAIEAIGEFAEGYRLNRPRTKFVGMFASDVPDTSVSLFVPPNNSLTASSSKEFTVRLGTPGVARSVPTTTLTVALEQAGVDKLDFMSMDIELSEPKALSGFDIDRFQPVFVCIESHHEVRQAILDYFADHRYVVVGKYLRVDPNNLYFQSATSRMASGR
jgi:Methyltransferase FkbM domain